MMTFLPEKPGEHYPQRSVCGRYSLVMYLDAPRNPLVAFVHDRLHKRFLGRYGNPDAARIACAYHAGATR